MTAIGLFDALVGPDDAGASPGVGPAAGLAALAAKLVTASLDDVRRIREYEQQFIFKVERRPAVDLEARRSVWLMFAAWADEAEQVLARAKSVARTCPPRRGCRRSGRRRLAGPRQADRSAGADCPRQ